MIFKILSKTALKLLVLKTQMGSFSNPSTNQYLLLIGGRIVYARDTVR